MKGETKGPIIDVSTYFVAQRRKNSFNLGTKCNVPLSSNRKLCRLTNLVDSFLLTFAAHTC